MARRDAMAIGKGSKFKPLLSAGKTWKAAWNSYVVSLQFFESEFP
jgi:hypothetical protein